MKKQLLYMFSILFLVQLNAQEFGTDDLLVTHCGGIGDATYNTSRPKSAYNSTDNNYLLIWYADDVDFAGIVDNETETYGQLIDANGSKIGDNFIITSHDGYGDRFTFSGVPSIAYNPIANNYLITYSGVIPTQYVNEVFGVIVNASGVVTTPGFKISEGGVTDNLEQSSTFSKVVYNATDNQYFVIYATSQEPDYITTFETNYIITGQLLDVNGNLVGTSHFPIGDTEANLFTASNIFPDMVWNSQDNEYYVTWTSALNDTDPAIRAYGQRISSTGQNIGPVNQLSDLVNNPAFDAGADDVTLAYNETNNSYMITYKDYFDATDYEIFAQSLNNLGLPVNNKTQVSNQQAFTSLSNFTPRDSSIVWDSFTSTYNVVWQGATAFDYESEIYMAKINTDGTIQTAEFPVSDFGIGGDGTSGGLTPHVSSNGDKALLISFTGQGDPDSGLATLEREVFIQMYGSSVLGVEDFTGIDSSVSIYPNPSKGDFFIKGIDLDLISKIDVYNSIGQRLKDNNFSKSTLIDLKTYASGMYIVSIKLKTGQTLKKQLIKL